jgi:hypothetical protein
MMAFLLDQIKSPVNRELQVTILYQKSMQKDGQSVNDFAAYLSTLENQINLQYKQKHLVMHLYSKLCPETESPSPTTPNSAQRGESWWREQLPLKTTCGEPAQHHHIPVATTPRALLAIPHVVPPTIQGNQRQIDQTPTKTQRPATTAALRGIGQGTAGRKQRDNLLVLDQTLYRQKNRAPPEHLASAGTT